MDGDGHDWRCDDLTRTPKGYLRCMLPLGHDEHLRPGQRLHAVDLSGPWYRLVEIPRNDTGSSGS